MRATRICRCVYDAFMDTKLAIANDRRVRWSRKPWRKAMAARYGFLEIHSVWTMERKKTSLLIKFMRGDVERGRINEWVDEHMKKNVQRRSL